MTTQPEDIEDRKVDCELQKTRNPQVAIARLSLNNNEVHQAHLRARLCEMRINTGVYKADYGKVCHRDGIADGHPLSHSELLQREVSTMEAHIEHAHRLMEYAKTYYMPIIVAAESKEAR